MALYKDAGVKGNLKSTAQVGHSFRFVLAAAIGEEDEGDALRLKIGQRLFCSR